MITSSKAQPQPNRSCFACGSDNAYGLRLQFTKSEDGSVVADWTTSPLFESFQGVIHGGIISTVLDEAMSQAVSLSGPAAMTCELRVRYRHHLAPGERVIARAWVVERHKRLVRTEATLSDCTGRECAHAWASFLFVS